MAYNSKSLNADDLGLAILDLDQIDDNFGFEDQTQKTGPVRDFRQSFKRGFLMQTRTRNLLRNFSRAALPDGYAQAIRSGERGYTNLSHIVADVRRETAPELAELARKAEQNLDVLERFSPSGKLNAAIKKRIEAARYNLESESNRLPSESERRQEEDRREISDALNFQNELEQGKLAQGERDAKANDLRDQIQRAQLRTVNENLDGVHDLLSRQVNYQDQVEYQYQRKSLEIQYRSLFMLRDLREIAVAGADANNKAYRSLINNTGLPEHFKYRHGERQSLSLNERINGQLERSVPEFLSNYYPQMQRNATQGITGLLRTALSGGSMMGGTGMSMGDMAGSMAGMGAGSFVANTLIPRLAMMAKPFAERQSHRAGGHDQTVAYWLNNMPSIIQDYTRDANQSVGWRGMLQNAVRSAAPQYYRNDELNEGSFQTINQQAAFNRLSQRSLVDIIPGYLSRILQETRMIRTGRDDVERETYDVTTGTFTGFQRARTAMLNRMVSPTDRRNAQMGVSDTVDQYDPDNQLSDEAREALKERLIRDAASNGRFTAEGYAGGEGYADGTSDEVLNELRDHFRQRFTFDENGRMEGNAENRRALNEHSQSFIRLRDTLPDTKDNIRKLVESGNIDQLHELGLVKSEGGQLRINYDRIWELYRSEDQHRQTDAFRARQEQSDNQERDAGRRARGFSEDLRDTLEEDAQPPGEGTSWRERITQAGGAATGFGANLWGGARRRAQGAFDAWRRDGDGSETAKEGGRHWGERIKNASFTPFESTNWKEKVFSPFIKERKEEEADPQSPRNRLSDILDVLRDRLPDRSKLREGGWRQQLNEMEAEREGREPGGRRRGAKDAAGRAARQAAGAAGAGGLFGAASDFFSGATGNSGTANSAIAGLAGAAAGGVVKGAYRGTRWGSRQAARGIRWGGSQVLRHGGRAALQMGGRAAMAGGATIAGAVSLPVLAVGAAAAAVGFGAYYLFQRYQDANAHLTRLRIAQYGVDPGREEQVDKVLAVEGLALQAVTWSGGTPTVDTQRMDVQRIAELFGYNANSRNEMMEMTEWFLGRFMPVLTKNLQALRSVDADMKLEDIDDDLSAKLKLRFIERVTFPYDGNSPYMVASSPFIDAPLSATLDTIRQAFQTAREEYTEEARVDEEGSWWRFSNAGNQAPRVLNHGKALELADDDDKVRAARNLREAGHHDAANRLMTSVRNSTQENFQASMLDLSRPIGDTLSPLQAIRMRAYGLVNLTRVEVMQALTLEDVLFPMVRFDGQGVVTLDVDPQEIAITHASLFGLNADTHSSDDIGRFVAWLRGRFIPAFQAYTGAVRKFNASVAFARAEGELTAPDELAVGNAIMGARGSNGGPPVWSIDVVPFKRQPLSQAQDMAERDMETLRERARAFTMGVEGNPDSEPGKHRSSQAPALIAKPRQDRADPGRPHTSGLMDAQQKLRNLTGRTGSGISAPYKPGGNVGQMGNVYRGMQGRELGHTIEGIPEFPKGGSKEQAMVTLRKVGEITGVSAGLLGTICNIESNFVADAANPRSNARGWFQFIPATWKTMLDRYGEFYGLAVGSMSDSEKQSLRFLPRVNALMGAEFLRENYNGLKAEFGRAPSDTDIYIAHFMGLWGAKKFLRADRNANAAQLWPDYAKSNPNIYYRGSGQARTVGEIYRLMAEKVASNRVDGGDGIQVSQSAPALEQEPIDTSAEGVNPDIVGVLKSPTDGSSSDQGASTSAQGTTSGQGSRSPNVQTAADSGGSGGSLPKWMAPRGSDVRQRPTTTTTTTEISSKQNAQIDRVMAETDDPDLLMRKLSAIEAGIDPDTITSPYGGGGDVRAGASFSYDTASNDSADKAATDRQRRTDRDADVKQRRLEEQTEASVNAQKETAGLALRQLSTQEAIRDHLGELVAQFTHINENGMKARIEGDLPPETIASREVNNRRSQQTRGTSNTPAPVNTRRS